MIKFIILLLVIGTFQCFGQATDNDYINELSRQYKYKNIMVVIPVSDKEHSIIIKWDKLHDYYLKNASNYKEKSFSFFLNDLYTNTLKFDLKKIQSFSYSIVNKNAVILNEYKKNGLEFIMDRYTNSSKGTVFAEVIDEDNLRGLIQIMFENNYFVYFSGYSGTYSFRYYKNNLKFGRQ